MSQPPSTGDSPPLPAADLPAAPQYVESTTPASPPPAPPAPVPAPAKSKTKMRLLIGALAVFVVGMLVFTAYLFDRNDPSNAKAGDCLAGTNPQDLKIVDCGKPHDYVVLGSVTSTARKGLSPRLACAAYPDTTTMFTEGRQGDPDATVLCLRAIH